MAGEPQTRVTGDTLKDFLASIAAAVTSMRHQRGLSRRNLASQSGVSERYLAQIETGEANMSLEKLWQIAEALGIDIVNLMPQRKAAVPDIRLQCLLASLNQQQQRAALQLVADHFDLSDGPSVRSGLAIVGMRGAGKTTLGQKLADALGVKFLRMSRLIEQAAAMQAHEIFALGGQQTWRRLEREALEKLVQTRTDIILETSGSLVSEPETYRLLRRSFSTVWLRCDARAHMQRVLRQGDLRATDGRNADAAMEDLRNILREREPLYRLADHQLDNSDVNSDHCLAQLIEIGKRYRIGQTRGTNHQ